MINRSAFCIRDQVTLADIGDVARFLIFREQMVKWLIARRAHFFGDRLIPFFAIGEDRIDVENDAAEIEMPVANNFANSKAAAGLAGRDDRASGL